MTRILARPGGQFQSLPAGVSIYEKRVFRPKLCHGFYAWLDGNSWVRRTSSFDQTAQGITTETIAIAKWVGIILCVICGIAPMAGGLATIAKVSGLLPGMVFALLCHPSSP